MDKPSTRRREAAESLAIQALNFLAEDSERLGRFLALSGIDPRSIRSAAADSGFLAGVLSHLDSDEALLVAFAAQAGVRPVEVDQARRVLAGSDWEREVP